MRKIVQVGKLLVLWTLLLLIPVLGFIVSLFDYLLHVVANTGMKLVKRWSD